MYCKHCGKEIPQDSKFCPDCGASSQETTQQPVINIINNPQPAAPVYAAPVVPGASPKNKWVAFMLCFLVGLIGGHRFYVGKVGTGILYFLTCGGFGIGWIIDMIVIICGNFTDKQGRKLL